MYMRLCTIGKSEQVGVERSAGGLDPALGCLLHAKKLGRFASTLPTHTKCRVGRMFL